MSEMTDSMLMHVRRTLGDEAAAVFSAQGYVFGYLAHRGDELAPRIPQYRYVCADCREWWGHRVEPEYYLDPETRAQMERRLTEQFAQRCPHLRARLERADRARQPAGEGQG